MGHTVTHRGATHPQRMGSELECMQITAGRGKAAEKACVKIVRKLKPNWKKFDIILWKLSENSWAGYSITNSEEKLFIKVFNQELEAQNNIHKYQLFSDHSFSPPLISSFTNGYVTQYMAGSSPAPSLLLEPTVYPHIARQVGSLHRQLTNQAPAPPSTNMFETLAQWLKSLPSEILETSEHGLPGLEELVDEISQVEDVLGNMKIKTVFGHGNLTPSNMIYLAEEPTVLFTGLTNAGPIWQPMEIATLFLAMFSVDKVDVVDITECMPQRSVQTRWLNIYLSSYNDTLLHHVTLLELDLLSRQVSLCCLFCLLRQVVWSLVTSRGEEKEDKYKNLSRERIIGYGAARYQLYKKIKYNVMSVEI